MNNFINIKAMSVSRKTAYLSALCAVAIIFSYAESLIPISVVPIPGFKLGFANIVIIIVLASFSLKSALLVSIARTVVVSLMFSNVTAAVLSLSGSILSIICMWALLKIDCFSLCGISVIGATAHNIGQLIAARFIIGSSAVYSYLPYLMLCSLVTGLLIGIASTYILKIIKKSFMQL